MEDSNETPALKAFSILWRYLDNIAWVDQLIIRVSFSFDFVFSFDMLRNTKKNLIRLRGCEKEEFKGAWTSIDRRLS